MTLRVVAFVLGVVGCTIAAAAKQAVAPAGVVTGHTLHLEVLK